MVRVVVARKSRIFNGAGAFTARIVRSVLRAEKADQTFIKPFVAVNFINDHAIARLNRAWKKRHGPTDVLSFNFNERSDGFFFLGEIYISVDTLRRQARKAGHSVRRELGILLIHGSLHLLGHEHNAGDRKRVVMQRKEAKYRSLLLGTV